MTFFQYYMLTKDALPLEIDFLAQDTFGLVRPNWKLVTELPEAAKLFGDAVSANYKTQGAEKTADQAEENEESGSEDGLGDGDADLEPVIVQSSEDEAEVSVKPHTPEFRLTLSRLKERMKTQRKDQRSTQMKTNRLSFIARQRNWIPRPKLTLNEHSRK